MRFALLGKHPDGLEMASALVASGRHELVVYTVPLPEVTLAHLGAARLVPDLEEVLANPAVEAVIVAGTAANRPEQLRRALQSERHVLCVHPADGAPDAAYEAGMIQVDTRTVLLPLLPDLFHPGVTRLAELLRGGDGALGQLRLIELEQAAPGSVLLEGDVPGFKPGLPGWDVLRRLGGEVAEVSAFAEREEVTAERPLLVAGRFERGGLLRMALLPGQRENRWRLAVTGDSGCAQLLFPLGRPGPAFLSWREPSGERREESWDITDPWPLLVEVFETALAGGVPAPVASAKNPVLSVQYSVLSTPLPPHPLAPASGARGANASPPPLLTWQDEVRCLELDDAARRSVERRRASTLEYQVASEEVGFKGTMTLVGCGLLWAIMLLAILSVWVPRLGWAVGPLLVLFLVLQVLLYVARRGKDQGPSGGSSGS
jgi:predicted dehydrogenase